MTETKKDKIDQNNFRVKQDQADAFRAWCVEQNISQAVGFERMLQALEMQQAKELIPGRATEIEAFEHHAHALVAAYLNSIELMQDTEERIKEQFQKMLQSKDEQIIDLQAKSKQKDAEIDEAKKQEAAAKAMQLQAEKDVAEAKSKQKSAEEMAADKADLAKLREKDLIEAKESLAAAKEKVDSYDALKAECDDHAKAVEQLENILKEKEKDFELQTERAARNAEKDQEQAVAKARAEMQETINDLQKQLQQAQIKAEQNLREAEKAVRTEMQKTIDGLQEKLDKDSAELRKLEQEKADLREKLAKAEAQIPKKEEKTEE